MGKMCEESRSRFARHCWQTSLIRQAPASSSATISTCPAIWSSRTPAGSAAKGSCRSGWARATGRVRASRRTGSRSRIRRRQPCGEKRKRIGAGDDDEKERRRELGDHGRWQATNLRHSKQLAIEAGPASSLRPKPASVPPYEAASACASVPAHTGPHEPLAIRLHGPCR
jgi:hypothetical protein